MTMNGTPRIGSCFLDTMSYASASGSSDSVHLAESFATWQPPAPSAVKGKHRDIAEIMSCCSDAMGWRSLQHVSVSHPGATLGHLDWRYVLSDVWQSAMQEGIRISGVPQPGDWHNEMDVETWQKILFACNIDTVEGLRRYVQAWGESDPVVFHWMQGAVKCEKPTADIGGWLADYCNTAFLVLSKQASPNVIYKVVSNALYRSLANLIRPLGMSAESSGDVWEQLCWHAYEHNRGAFVLSVIWNTTNRCLDAPAASAHVSSPPRPPAAVRGSTSGDTGLTMEEATRLQRRNRPSGLHKAMRETLQEVAAATEENPYERRREVPPTLPWREYIAFHDKCELFVGSGIDRFYLYFMPEVDPQKVRGGQLRLNYVIERQDGTVVLLHPGTKPRNDAKPILLTAREFQLKLGYE